LLAVFKNTAPWWLKLFYPYKKMLLLGLAATVLCGVAAAWVPYWAGDAVKAIEAGNYPLSRNCLKWMLAVTAAAGVGRYFMRNILIGLSRQIERRQREELYDFLLSRPFSFYERQTTGDLMSRVGDDVLTVRMATGPGLMSLLQTASILPMTLALMLKTEPSVTLATLLPFALLPLFFYFLGRWGHITQQKLQLANSRLNTFSHEAISGEKVIQAFGLEDIRADEFTKLSKEQARLNVLQTAFFSSYGPFAAVMGGASVIVLIWYGGAMVAAGRLGIGDLTAFTGYLGALGWPVMSLGWAANLFQRGKAGQLRIQQLFAQPFEALPKPMPIHAGHEAMSLEARDIEIRFESGRGLGPISVSVPAGGSLAIVGGIGSGKTILLQALAGLREPQRGCMLVNGKALDKSALRQYWAALGWAPQEATLFSGTLRDNLGIGNPSASEEKMMEAARAACLDGFIRSLPQGLDAVVGERGVVLSGGERQRAALARALLRRPGALLLDDCLSAVDAETESGILNNLETFLGRATLVLATHRIFAAELCERVIVLENGRIIQAGTPEELRRADGQYAKLRALQSIERQMAGGLR